MNSGKRGEPSSPVWSEGDVIDHLIHQALLEEVGDAEPSAQVWKNICRQVKAAERPPVRRARYGAGFYRGLEGFLRLFLHDQGWETRLAERRPIVMLPGSFLLVA